MSETPETPVLTERRDNVLLITLNRPDRLNAFNETMHMALRAALNRAALGAAAQCLGLAQRMIEISVAYTRDRQQFARSLGRIALDGHRIDGVVPADEKSNVERCFVVTASTKEVAFL